MSREQALKYQSRLQAGEFLVSVVGSPEEIETARNVLEETDKVDLQCFTKAQNAA